MEREYGQKKNKGGKVQPTLQKARTFVSNAPADLNFNKNQRFDSNQSRLREKSVITPSQVIIPKSIDSPKLIQSPIQSQNKQISRILIENDVISDMGYNDSVNRNSSSANPYSVEFNRDSINVYDIKHEYCNPHRAINSVDNRIFDFVNKINEKDIGEKSNISPTNSVIKRSTNLKLESDSSDNNIESIKSQKNTFTEKFDYESIEKQSVSNQYPERISNRHNTVMSMMAPNNYEIAFQPKREWIKDPTRRILLLGGKTYKIIKSSQYLKDHFNIIMHTYGGIVCYGFSALDKKDII